MSRRKKYTIEAIARALKKHDGIQYYAAEELGCDPSLISIRVKEEPELAEIVEDGLRTLDGKATRVLHEGLARRERVPVYNEGRLAGYEVLDDPDKIAVDTAKWIKARLSKSRFSERQEVVSPDAVREAQAKMADLILRYVPDEERDEFIDQLNRLDGILS